MLCLLAEMFCAIFRYFSKLASLVYRVERNNLYFAELVLLKSKWIHRLAFYMPDLTENFRLDPKVRSAQMQL